MSIMRTFTKSDYYIRPITPMKIILYRNVIGNRPGLNFIQNLWSNSLHPTRKTRLHYEFHFLDLISEINEFFL